MKLNEPTAMFESHVTVEGMGKQSFLDHCAGIGVKPILISEAGVSQAMTGKFHKGTKQNSLAEMRSIHDSFPADVNVIRSKLEQIVGKNGLPSEYLYLEFHTKFSVPTERKMEFLETALALGSSTSTNELKDQNHWFLTNRDSEKHSSAVGILAGKGYGVLQTIRECVIFDSNPEIDTFWMPCMGCRLKSIGDKK